MIRALAWLGLATDDPGAANDFYEPLLGPPQRGPSEELRYPVGGSELRLKPPEATPPGGAHVHYAFSTSPDAYETYKSMMAEHSEVEEYDLRVYRSAYAFDPDDHCVEFAARDEGGNGISSIFEIVLEVESLERAERWYQRFDPDLMDRGEERRRVRLDMGPFEIELWEPQRGIADARPGAHVDVGLVVEEVDPVIQELGEAREGIEPPDKGTRIVDPDGHHLTLFES